jgi:rare lipoprotein A
MKKYIIIILSVILSAMLFAQFESKAVIYEEGFEGSVTASGDIYSQEKLTAAHASLPLGTQVEIMNILNGKKVIVTVNDRIDVPDLFWVSSAAAKSIDLETLMPMEILYTVIGEPVSAGPSDVYLTLFESLGENLEYPQGDPQVPFSTGDEVKGYGVQVYACNKRMDAVTLSRRIQQELDYISYFEKHKTDDGSIFRVVIGDFETEAEALDCYRKLRHDLPEIFLVEIY